MNQLTAYTLRLGDNCLVLSQRLGEWCGHAPELEIDLALANIGLDLLGQARNFLSYAAELAGEGDEDTLAFTRDERQFSNLLLVEQPNGNFADTIARQYFIDAWHVALFTRLMESRDPQLAAISAKAIKEARYHLRFSRGWLERLGNGTDVSGQKMQQAINKLWRFTAELFDADEIDIALSEEGIAVDPRTLRAAWEAEVFAGINEATLNVPQEQAYRTGGKKGLHTEHLGPMLAEMQYLQRVLPEGIVDFLCDFSANTFDLTRGKVADDAFLGMRNYLLVALHLKLESVLRMPDPVAIQTESSFFRDGEAIADSFELAHCMAAAIVQDFQRTVNGDHIVNGGSIGYPGVEELIKLT